MRARVCVRVRARVCVCVFVRARDSDHEGVEDGPAAGHELDEPPRIRSELREGERKRGGNIYI